MSLGPRSIDGRLQANQPSDGDAGNVGVTSMVRKGSLDERLEELRIAVADLDPAGRGNWRVDGEQERTSVLVLESREADGRADVFARDKISVFDASPSVPFVILSTQLTGSITARVSRATIGRFIGIVLVQSDEGLQVLANILNELGESVVHVAGLLIRERFSAPIMGGGDEHLLDDE